MQQSPKRSLNISSADGHVQYVYMSVKIVLIISGRHYLKLFSSGLVKIDFIYIVSKGNKCQHEKYQTTFVIQIITVYIQLTTFTEVLLR